MNFLAVQKALARVANSFRFTTPHTPETKSAITETLYYEAIYIRYMMSASKIASKIAVDEVEVIATHVFNHAVKAAWFNLGLHEAPPSPPPTGGGLGGPQVMLAAILEAQNSVPPPNSPRAGVTTPPTILRKS